MKKILSVAIVLCLIFTCFTVSAVLAEETEYDYVTVLDAEDFAEGTTAQQVKTEKTLNRSNQATVEIVASEKSGGTKVLKLGRTTQYDEQGLWYADSEKIPAAAKDSLGFRIWAGAESDETMLTDLILTFRVKNSDDSYTYCSTVGNWGARLLPAVTVEGQWITVMWNEMKLDPNSAFNDGRNIAYFKSNGNAKAYLTEDQIAGIDAVFVTNKQTTADDVSKYYYVDDMQFIKEKSAEPQEVQGETTNGLATKDAASIRLSEKSGIRFYTTFDASQIDGTVVEKGTLIGPADIIGDYLTIEDYDDGNALVVKYESDILWENDEIVGSIVDIKETNYTREFTARGYVKLEDGTYLYSATTSTRTVAGIASAYKDDTEKYNELDDAHKALVDAWANANV